MTNQNDREVIRHKLIVANLSAEESRGKGKVSLPLQASFHLQRSQCKKLPRIPIPVGVSWGTRVFKEHRQETEQSCPSQWRLVQVRDWSSNCCKPRKEAGKAWGESERRRRQTSPPCNFGRFESCAHARKVQICRNADTSCSLHLLPWWKVAGIQWLIFKGWWSHKKCPMP